MDQSLLERSITTMTAIAPTIAENMDMYLRTCESGKWFTLSDLLVEQREAMGRPLLSDETEAYKAWWNTFNPSGALRVYPNGVIHCSSHHTQGYMEDFNE
jgi:hypothetical protein